VVSYIEKFIETKKNISNLSKKEYKKTISLLYSYMKDNNFNEINKIVIESFILYLEDKNYKITSINKYISIINNYLFYLFEIGYIKEVVKIKHLKSIKEENKTILSNNEFKKIICLIELNFENSKRNILLLYFLFYSKLKLNQVLSLKENDFYDDFQFLKIEDKIISLDIEIMNYLNEYKCEENEYLFRNKTGNKLSRQSVWKFIKQYNEKLSVNLSIDILNRSYKINKLLKNYK